MLQWRPTIDTVQASHRNANSRRRSVGVEASGVDMVEMRPSGFDPDLRLGLTGKVAVLEICRPPNNYFDAALLDAIARTYASLEAEDRCRAIVLAAQGNAFCAGTDHAKPHDQKHVTKPGLSPIAEAAIRLFQPKLPVIAAVEGAAVGGGMGLALSADFRVVGPKARFWPNFSKLGMHAGFGLTVTLPGLVGAQRAAEILYTGQRLDGQQALKIGLADYLVGDGEVRSRALSLAEEIAQASPLAVQSMRRTLRRGLAERIEVAMERELLEQTWQRQTDDFREGKTAMAARRTPDFVGH